MWVTGATHTGMKRGSNQDTLLTGSLDGGCYAVVCDGMGGEKGGNIASDIAARTIRDRITRDLRPGLSSQSVEHILRSGAAAANAEVYDAAAADPGLEGMGTTLVAAAVLGQEAYLIHAGDSRAYLLRDGALTQLTTDHTIVQMLVDRGQLSEHEAASHPQRHYITRAVGVGREISFDFDQFLLREGDCLLLCTDGLYNYVSRGELAALTAVSLGKGNVRPLIDRANQNGGGDNITAALVSVSGREDQPNG